MHVTAASIRSNILKFFTAVGDNGEEFKYTEGREKELQIQQYQSCSTVSNP